MRLARWFSWQAGVQPLVRPPVPLWHSLSACISFAKIVALSSLRPLLQLHILSPTHTRCTGAKTRADMYQAFELIYPTLQSLTSCLDLVPESYPTHLMHRP